MSVRVMTLVWALDLPDSEKIVLLALADCANDEGHCWPGMPSLVKKCSKSDRTIQASIKSLVEAGHLTRREVPGKGCNYTVHPRSHITPEAVSPPKLATPTPEAVSGKPSGTVISSEPKGSSPRPWALPAGVGHQVWTDFLSNRKRKRLGNTPTAWKSFQDDLTRVSSQTGIPPPQLIEQCTAKGWGAIYDPRDSGNDQRSVSRTRPNLTDLHRAATAASRDLEDRGGTGPPLPALGHG